MNTIKKVSNYRNQPQMDDINRLVSEVQALVDSGGKGDKGDKGDDGFNGYTPITSLQPRGDDIVVRLDDWVGGTGNAPTQLVGRFLSPTGWVEGIENGLNVRGLQGAKGGAGLDGDNGVGIPMGGATGQVLAKASADSYDTEWIEPPSGGGGGATKFTELTDTPNDLGQSGQVLMSGIDFNTMSPTIEWATLNYPTKITDLSDIPNTLGNEGDILVVRFNMNTFQDELTFEPLPTGGGGGGDVTLQDFTPIVEGVPIGNVQQVTGKYYEEGNKVTIFVRAVVTAVAGDFPIRIGGLPYDIASLPNEQPVAFTPIGNIKLPANIAGCSTNPHSNQLWVFDKDGKLVNWGKTARKAISLQVTYLKG